MQNLFILYFYSIRRIFYLITNMQLTNRWLQVRNLACKRDRYPGYVEEFCIIWSCFCYSASINGEE